MINFNIPPCVGTEIQYIDEAITEYQRALETHINSGEVYFKIGNAHYYKNDLVLDNPPFSLYSKIVRNYMRMGVKFFLFAPALSLFVPDSGANYVITGANITYANGANVRTSFVTNILPYKILIAHGLQKAIHDAQRTNTAKTYRPAMPEQYWSSAQLLRFANNSDFNFKPITATEDFIKYDNNNKKIFGAAIKIGKTDNDLFNNIKAL